MTACKSCARYIVRCQLENGLWIPADPGKNDDGNLLIVGERPSGEPIVRQVQKTFRGNKLISHWSTCPNPRKLAQRRTPIRRIPGNVVVPAGQNPDDEGFKP